jgi:hypothetical protein
MSYASLRDQREAALAVKEYQGVPANAASIGSVDASRCHRNTLQAQPSEAEIKADLKVAAYARGADGIADVKITQGSGLLQNCWLIINGSATAFSIQK